LSEETTLFYLDAVAECEEEEIPVPASWRTSSPGPDYGYFSSLRIEGPGMGQVSLPDPELGIMVFSIKCSFLDEKFIFYHNVRIYNHTSLQRCIITPAGHCQYKMPPRKTLPSQGLQCYWGIGLR